MKRVPGAQPLVLLLVYSYGNGVQLKLFQVVSSVPPFGAVREPELES